MQTKALILVIFLFCHPAVKADVNPTIQAVCKVNLRNGTIAEGFILLGSGNYEGIWMNGFNLETRQGGQRHDKQFFFDLDFRYILCTDSTIECAMKENNSLSRYLKVDKMNITFLLWKRNPSDYDSIKYSSVDHSIKFIRHSEREYLLLDSLTIYQDLTSGTFIDSVDNFQKPPKRIKGSKIAVKDVGRFEILANPENAWLVSHYPFWGFKTDPHGGPPVSLLASLQTAWETSAPKGYSLILSVSLFFPSKDG